jgi:hypothetical protein
MWQLSNGQAHCLPQSDHYYDNTSWAMNQCNGDCRGKYPDSIGSCVLDKIHKCYRRCRCDLQPTTTLPP